MIPRLDISIGQRLTLGFGAAGALIVALVTVTQIWAADVVAARRHQNEVIAPRAAAADRLERDVLYLGVAARNYVLVPEARRWEEYERAARTVREDLHVLAGLAKDADGGAVLAPIPSLVERYERAAAVTTAAARDRRAVEELEPPMAAAREDLLLALRTYVSLQERKSERARQEIGAAVDRMRRANVAAGGLVLLFLGLAALATARSVRRPTLALVHAARRLSAGDFAPAVELAAPSRARPLRDEVVELSHSFGRMALDLRAREERLRAAAELAGVLASSLDLPRLCAASLDVIVRHLGLEVAGLYLLEPDGRFRRRFAIGLPPDEEPVAVGEGIAGRAAQSKRAVVIADLPGDAPFTIRLGVDRLPPRAIAAVPLLLQHERVGGVLLAASVRPLPAEAIVFLQQSASQLAVSVQNALGHERIGALAAELQEKNEKLQVQYEEIQAQQEELQAQHEELQSQNEELQVQGEELQTQGDELRRTVDRLTRSEERYHGLFTHLSEGFALHEMVFDEAGRGVDYRFLVANEAFERATGLSAARIAGRTVREVMPAIEHDWIERYAEVVRTGSPARFQEYSAALQRHYQVIAFRVTAREFATLLLDITDQKRAEEALKNADRNKDEFLAVLSHELRNPLAPIRNSIHVLERAQPGSEQARRALTVIDRQVNQLARLVGDLLDVTRISRGKVRLQRTRVDLGRLVRQAAEDHAAAFADAGVALETVVDGAAVVDGDPARLSQVLGNLLQNAVKFTGRRGHVLLAMELAGGRARIRVRDDGAGMTEQTLGRLFEPFMQADVTLARTNGGLGLGLALVKGLVELHSGSVRASSEGIGKGTELILELPVVPGAALVPAHRPGAPAAARRILVVEDNVDAADSLREALALGGHEVEVAYRGAEGVAKARAWRPDVMLCDIGLPDMDGHAVARSVRSEPALRGVLLVALSGYALPADLARAKEAGFDEHLAKPPSLERLEELLAGVGAGSGRELHDPAEG